MTEVAVSNSSCLIALERINKMEILIKSFDHLFIPYAVQEEFDKKIDMISVRKAKNTAVVASLNTQIGKGESEAIALAMEIKNSFLILDDKKARRIAKQLELKIIGTIGLLLRAKSKNVITSIEPFLEDFQKVGFRISHKLYLEAKHLSGEFTG